MKDLIKEYIIKEHKDSRKLYPSDINILSYALKDYMVLEVKYAVKWVETRTIEVSLLDLLDLRYTRD